MHRLIFRLLDPAVPTLRCEDKRSLIQCTRPAQEIRFLKAKPNTCQGEKDARFQSSGLRMHNCRR